MAALMVSWMVGQLDQCLAEMLVATKADLLVYLTVVLME